MLIRPEQPEDRVAIRAIHQHAFTTSAEARLVDNLRASECSFLSLVAEEHGQLLAHLLITPVTLPIAQRPLSMAAIGPMAVLPEHQRQGVGTQLMQAALRFAEEDGIDVLFVLGHPRFYQRFAFTAASAFGISCEYPVPEEVFMLRELSPGCLQGSSGQVAYQEAFNKL